MRLGICFFIAVAMTLASGVVRADTLRLAVTTSFNNSGLSDFLLPEIYKELNMKVDLLVVGTGQALRLARAGDVDAVLVHSPAAEKAFVDEGYAAHRREIMYNDFVLIGPSDDPAGVSDARDASTAFTRIRNARSLFVSRGDESGTHKKEMSLWKLSNVRPEDLEARWYRSVGAGMGASLNTAGGLDAYILADRASWLKFGNKAGLKLLFEGDPELFNQYSFLPVSKDKHSHAKSALAQRLEDWLTSQKGQRLIATYQLNGQSLFIPNARPR